MNAQEIKELAAKINGRARNRTIGQREIETFAELVDENKDNSEVTTIRVYSAQGFVANAYKWRAEIAALTAARNAETGQFEIGGGWFDAHRSHGQGALITINGRAA
jgi:hypothetical protein